MLGYTDFAPEASVDDDSTKLLSVNIQLEEITKHTYITVLIIWTPIAQRFCAFQSTGNILAWITRVHQTYLVSQHKIVIRNRDQGTRTTHSKAGGVDAWVEVSPSSAWEPSVPCCLWPLKCWKRFPRAGFKVEAGGFWSRGRVELAAASVLRVEGEPPRLDVDPARPWKVPLWEGNDWRRAAQVKPQVG